VFTAESLKKGARATIILIATATAIAEVKIMSDCRKMSREELMRDLQAADFAAYELQLFLDTHPNDPRALMMFSQATQNAQSLKNEYESMYGPITAAGAAFKMPWQWIESPWNWE
jgi:spore coat protein JB